MIPQYIRKFLWSCDWKKMDLSKNKERIILNILNIGDIKAAKWLFKTYSKPVIKKVLIDHGAHGELNDKSLNYWTFILDVDQTKLSKSRF